MISQASEGSPLSVTSVVSLVPMFSGAPVHAMANAAVDDISPAAANRTAIPSFFMAFAFSLQTGGKTLITGAFLQVPSHRYKPLILLR
jgi:hypothetical protein